MNYKTLTKKLLSTVCYEIKRRGGGSHRKWFNPATGRGTTIPDWGKKDLKAIPVNEWHSLHSRL